jgi:ubiquinone/menaquinone biosynthesis C-methylase UbiE
MVSMKTKPEILKYYASGVEKSRLSKGVFSLEKVRTQELVSRLLPSKKCKILDIGAGAGFYSFWLKGLGHEVHMIDPSPKNLEIVRLQERTSGKLASINQADARKLPFEKNKFDVVLMLGPLYHLTTKKERLKAIREAKRVLKGQGVLIAVGISRYASLFEGFFNKGINLNGFISMMNEDISTGQHRNKTGRFDFFTTAYFHRPYELKNEVKEAGFKSPRLLAIESFGWLSSDFAKLWSNSQKRKLLLDTIRKVESDPELMAVSAHVMVTSLK